MPREAIEVTQRIFFIAALAVIASSEHDALDAKEAAHDQH